MENSYISKFALVEGASRGIENFFLNNILNGFFKFHSLGPFLQSIILFESLFTILYKFSMSVESFSIVSMFSLIKGKSFLELVVSLFSSKEGFL
jgi:hypothetical protein